MVNSNNQALDPILNGHLRVSYINMHLLTCWLQSATKRLTMSLCSHLPGPEAHPHRSFFHKYAVHRPSTICTSLTCTIQSPLPPPHFEPNLYIYLFSCWAISSLPPTPLDTETQCPFEFLYSHTLRPL